MLIDNRKSLDKDEKQPANLYKFFEGNMSEGSFDLVSGYFSIAMLADFLEKYPDITKFRMILGNLTKGENTEKAKINLLADEPDIEGTFSLSLNAQKAVQFLRKENVFIRTYQDRFCHAKAYIYENKKKSNDSFFSIGSSNFTHAGLRDNPQSNIELNYARTGEDADFGQIKKWFEQIWKECKEKVKSKDDGEEITFREDLIRLIEKIYQEYKPIEIYYKILFELFYEQVQAESIEFNQKKLVHLKESLIWNRLFTFQKQGVLNLISMLQNYGGAILADAVGLGKTWQALAVIKFFELEGYKTVLLCPKKLSYNWQRYQGGNGSLFEADDLRYVVHFHTDLQEDTEKGTNRLEKDDFKTLKRYFQNNPKILFVIDESHNLRNDQSSRYQFLVEKLLSEEHSYNKEVKTLLLSATPINTKLTDIRNQFKLLVRGNDRGFEPFEQLKINSLEDLFRNVQGTFNKWQKENDEPKVSDFIQEVPQGFFRLTDALVVARTRKMIEKQILDTQTLSEEEIKIQASLSFPKKQSPINCYHLPSKFGELDSANKIINALEGLHFWAYQPAKYQNINWEKKKVTENESQRQGFLARMMFFLLIKRLESSWHSFHSTLSNILKHHQNALDKVNQFIENRSLKISLSTVPSPNEDEIEGMADENAESKAFSELIEAYTLGKKELPLSSIDKIEAFQKDLQAEVKRLENIAANLAIYKKELEEGKAKDEKLLELITQIKAKRKQGNNPKVLIFTVFKDTAIYLYEALEKEFPNEGIAYVAGSESKSTYGYVGAKFEPILEQFAPYTKLFKEGDWFDDDFLKYYTQNQAAHNLSNAEKEAIHKKVTFEEWTAYLKTQQTQRYQEKISKSINILIATDCLAEGQNLQDCDCVVNYDIHWNPVRLIQRFGRIDRIGSPNKSIKGINFWIGQDYEDALNLKNRVEKRMAIMALAGTETMDELTPEMKKLMEDNPLVSKQEQSMLDKMHTTWEDIEVSNQTLSLADFSLQIFRDELLEYISRNKGILENMPNGVFSGFKLPQNLFVQVGNTFKDKNLIALLKHKKEKEHHLLFTNQEGENIFINHYFVLQFLREHKNEARHINNAIDKGEKDALQSYAQMLKNNLNAVSEHQDKKDLKAAAKQGLSAMKMLGKQEDASKKYFQMENFELVVWEAIESEKALKNIPRFE